jgi:N-acylneuraminate cytidylyltransferase
MNPPAHNVIALIPARTGSKRIADKNILPLKGHPLLAYAIESALQSKVFSRVLVSTDSKEYSHVATHYGAEVPFLRPVELATDSSPDFEWIDDTLRRLGNMERTYDAFAILRPSNPFRTPETIRRAWNAFLEDPTTDSLRAVEPCKQHPGKMWVVEGRRMLPLLPFKTDGHPWHSRPTQHLPEIVAQNASLEIAWTRVVFESHTISGTVVKPIFTEGFEGFDLNTPEDWSRAVNLVQEGSVRLTEIARAPHPKGNEGRMR